MSHQVAALVVGEVRQAYARIAEIAVRDLFLADHDDPVLTAFCKITRRLKISV